MAYRVGSDSARKAFNALWRIRGEPLLRIVEPISAWSLPAGASYDRYQDRFVNSGGSPIAVDWTLQPYLSVGFLEETSNHAVELAVIGEVTTDSITVKLLWSADVESRVKTCWGIGIDNRLYRVKSWQVQPKGTVTPTNIQMVLSEGIS